MKQFTDLGLEVPLTELDVRVQVGPADVANSTGLTAQCVLRIHRNEFHCLICQSFDRYIGLPITRLPSRPVSTTRFALV